MEHLIQVPSDIDLRQQELRLYNYSRTISRQYYIATNPNLHPNLNNPSKYPKPYSNPYTNLYPNLWEPIQKYGFVTK